MTFPFARTMILALLLPAAASAAKPAMADRDQDGVADADDLCPYTQSKTAVDAQGCTLDSDFDGVADGSDQCPYSKFGAPVNAEGCSREERGGKPELAAAPVAAQPPAAAQTASAELPAPPPALVAPAPPAAPVVSPILPAATVPVTPAVPKKKPAPRVVAAPIGNGFASALPPPPMAPELPLDEPLPAPNPAAAPPATPAAPPSPPAPAVAEAPAMAPPAAPAAAAADLTAPIQADGVPAPPEDAQTKEQAELLPLLNDEGALLAAIDRRNQERAAAEERESRERLAQMLDDRGTTGAAPAPRSRAAKPSRSAPAAMGREAAKPARANPPTTLSELVAPPARPLAPRNTERLLADVHFAAGRSDIGAATLRNLPALMPDLARIIGRMPTLRVEVVGHADGGSEGPRAEKLAGERAMAMNAWLVGHGVPPSRIKRINKADTDPIGSGADNRVVEIYTYPQ